MSELIFVEFYSWNKKSFAKWSFRSGGGGGDGTHSKRLLNWRRWFYTAFAECKYLHSKMEYVLASSNRDDDDANGWRKMVFLSPYQIVIVVTQYSSNNYNFKPTNKIQNN